jgi:site-specific recombinase
MALAQPVTPTTTTPTPAPTPGDGAQSWDGFCLRFERRTAQPRALRPLFAMLANLPVGKPLAQRLDLLEQLSRWLRGGGNGMVNQMEGGGFESARTARLRLLVIVLEEVPLWRAAFRTLFGQVLAETTGLHLLSEVGLPNHRGFFQEAGDRVARRWLPAPPGEHRLVALVARMFPGRKDASWLRGIPAELSVRLIRVLSSSAPSSAPAADPAAADAAGPPTPLPAAPEETDDWIWEPLHACVLDALNLLVLRVSSLGLSFEIRERSPECPLRESPFFLLRRDLDDWVQRVHAREDGHDDPQHVAQCREHMAACAAALEAVRERLEGSGVSVDVVYQMDVIEKSLSRIDSLLTILGNTPEIERCVAGLQLLGELSLARIRDQSIRDLFRSNTALLARKIIERAGDTGEHYITASRREYFKMLLSAGGGGVLTAGTAVLKYLAIGGGFAPFVEGFLVSANYGASWVLMQIMGFTLATKQPSMTAAALAGTLKEAAGHADRKLDDLVTIIARMVRSQLAAAFGNVSLVVPAAYLLDLLWVHKAGHHFFDAAGAEHAFSTVDPIHTPLILYGAETGVILWAGSLAAGWFGNWAVYNRLPEAIAEHRFGRFLGRNNMRRIGHWFGHNVSGFGGSIALGCFMGFAPVLGKFTGLPIDIRHVTLSTGTFALAVCSAGPATLLHREFLLGVLGIFTILVMNFGVSFALALTVALRARDVTSTERFRLFRAVGSRFIHHPREFFLPPKDVPGAPPSSTHGGASHHPPPASSAPPPPPAPPAPAQAAGTSAST